MDQETESSHGPVLTGVCQVTEKMEKRTCALCPKGDDWSVIYFAQSANIAAHENCLLYSSALVECENDDQCNTYTNFDVKSVLKEIWRGSWLRCSLCNNKGATVRCNETSCANTYHLLCAKEDKTFLQVDGVHGTYKLYCQDHPPEKEETTQSISILADGSNTKRKRGSRKRVSSGSPVQPTKMKFKRSKRHLIEESLNHTDAIVKVPFLKKCKEAGLLTELFKGILEKMNLIQGRLMEETASESDYEEIETLLFDSGLFEDTLIKFNEVIKSKACEHEEMQRQLKQQLEALEDLKQTLCSHQENGDLAQSSSFQDP